MEINNVVPYIPIPHRGGTCCKTAQSETTMPDTRQIRFVTWEKGPHFSVESQENVECMTESQVSTLFSPPCLSFCRRTH